MRKHEVLDQLIALQEAFPEDTFRLLSSPAPHGRTDWGIERFLDEDGTENGTVRTRTYWSIAWIGHTLRTA